jgi:hypothetical protein
MTTKPYDQNSPQPKPNLLDALLIDIDGTFKRGSFPIFRFSIQDAFSTNETESFQRRGQKVKGMSATSVYNVLLTDYLVSIPSVSVAPQVTLPLAKTAGFYKIYAFSDASGSAASTSITILAREGDVINGDYTYPINTNWGSVRLYCSGGSSWSTY